MTEKRNRVDSLLDGLLLAAGVALTLVLIGNVFYFPRLMHDVALYISMGQRVALGAVPYVDVVDTNPPMILYLSTLPALISKIYGTPLAMTALVFFLGLVLILGLGFLLALKLANPQTSRRALAVVWIFWVWASLWVYQLGIFAQREHFIFLLMAGFVVIRQGRYAGTKIKPGWAALYGVLAAMGIGMKPHYLLPWLGIELLLMGLYAREALLQATRSGKDFRTRIRQLFQGLRAPELLALVISGLLYLGHFFILPGMSSYYTYWIPLFARGYKVMDTGWSQLFYPRLVTPLLEFWPVALLAIGGLIWLRREKRLTLPVLPLAFLVVSLLTLAVYILQKKGWFYQSIGFHLGLLTALGLLLGDFLQKTASQTLKTLVTAGLLGALVLANAPAANATWQKFSTARESWLQSPADSYSTLISHLTRPNESAMFIGTSLGDIFPAITYLGRLNASRFGMAIPLSIILSDAGKNTIRPEWQADEKIYYAGLVEDLQKNQPRLVLVSSLKDTVEKITVSRYLESRSFYQTSLRGYTCVGKIDNHYFVYVRLDPADPYYTEGVAFLYESQLVRPFPPDCSLEQK
jgi:hypothetical protein